MIVTVKGKCSADPAQRVLAIEAAAKELSCAAGEDPADAVMTLLTAAVRVAKRHSDLPWSDLGIGLANALGMAIVAADEMFRLGPIAPGSAAEDQDRG